MASSQALSQSVFGNLKVYGKLSCLRDIQDDSSDFLFDDADLSVQNLKMEYTVDYLGELPPRQTSIDVFFGGGYRIAFEGKLPFKQFKVYPIIPKGINLIKDQDSRQIRMS